MSQLTLSWQEEGNARSHTLDLSFPGAVRLGRDPDLCDVVFQDPSVSRLHAEIRWSALDGRFYIQSLSSSNPIEVDHQQLHGTRLIQNGTTIMLGDTTVQVAKNDAPATMAPASATMARAPVSSITLSHYLPLAGTRRELRQQGYLVPGIITVISVVLLFLTEGYPQIFNPLLAGYLGLSGFYLIYKLCGKCKPWWVIAIPLIATPILIFSPVWRAIAFLFRDILPGHPPEDPSAFGFIPLFIVFFFGAGLAEELLKALPVLAISWYGQLSDSSAREKFGVPEPLDGIILGAASGLGFTLIETLEQYVPHAIDVETIHHQPGMGQLSGLHILIARMVASVFGHLAYSGCFGYYIGLSNLKPKRRWKFLGIGYLVAASTHALWNSSLALGIWALGLAGILAYCLLMGAIIKARQLSPR